MRNNPVHNTATNYSTFASRHMSLCVSLTTMAFPSQTETHDSNTPSGLSIRTSMNGAEFRLSSIGTTIQSDRGSITNSSMHTTSTAATRKDLIDCSISPISHRKSFHSLEKPTSRFKNQSQNTTASPTPRPSVYDISTLPVPRRPPGPGSNRIPPFAPLDAPLTKPYGDSQPFATTETPTADNPAARHPFSLPPTTDRIGTTSLSRTTPSTKGTTTSVSGTVTNHKIHDTSSPFTPWSHPGRTPKVTVAYDKLSSKEYDEPLRKAKVDPTNGKVRPIRSTQSPPPPSSHNASKSSRSQEKATSDEPPRKAKVDPTNGKIRSIRSTQATPPPSSHNASMRSRSQGKGTSAVSRRQPHPFQMKSVNLVTDPISLSTAPTAPSDGLPEASPVPTGSIGINSRSRATKGKKGMVGILIDFLKSHKRPEISGAYDPVHITHVSFDPSTGEFTGLPKEWEQILQDTGTSKSGQEKNPLGVIEIVKSCQNWADTSSEVALTSFYAQCAATLTISVVPKRDEHWILLAKSLPVSASLLPHEHADGILLANAIFIVRITVQMYFGSEETDRDDILNMSRRTLRAVCELDIRHTSAELQHEFCDLWKKLVRTAQTDQVHHHRFVSEKMLKNTRKLYIALHGAPYTDDQDQVRDNSGFYPECTEDGHCRSSSFPNLKFNAPRTQSDAPIPSGMQFPERQTLVHRRPPSPDQPPVLPSFESLCPVPQSQLTLPHASNIPRGRNVQ